MAKASVIAGEIYHRETPPRRRAKKRGLVRGNAASKYAAYSISGACHHARNGHLSALAALSCMAYGVAAGEEA